MTIVGSNNNNDKDTNGETARFLNTKDSLDERENRPPTIQPKMATQAWIYIVFWICKNILFYFN